MRRSVLVGVAALACGPGAAAATPSPWNGSWILDATRSSAGAREFAAPGYRFLIDQDNGLTWEIPAIGEVVKGHTDGRPMAVHRNTPTPGLTLSVEADGPLLLHYVVARNGHPQGGGLMRLIEGGKAWVDISWQVSRPEDAGELVYLRR